MKANELRINNWFIEYNEPQQFDGDFYHLSDIKPIQLTEEWLLNFGFKKTDNKYIDNYIIPISAGYWHSVNYDDEDCEWYYNNDYSNASCYYVSSIKYVHQLQNLYFALTGKELIIKNHI